MLSDTLRQRRQRLAQLIQFPVTLWAGHRSSRNYPANCFPFRASSHFLYFAGLPLENAAIRLDQGQLELFWDEASPESLLWHGPTPRREEIAAQMGADRAFPLADLQARVQEDATIPVQDSLTRQHQTEILHRPIGGETALRGNDRPLAQAIITLRLTQDEAALTEIRRAAAVTVQAHQAGMEATPQAHTEAQIRAVMEGAMISQNMTLAYPSIVTVHGEVLHNDHSPHPLHPGDLILADVGAETASGWASDVTRTWPVSGYFSASQRDLYQIVLAAHDACIAKIRPGVEYRDIHGLAAQVITAGLVSLGILRGNVQDLVEQDVHALFFPHGVGHLLGLDVHDMEDLGDLAGYEPGRKRSDRFGLCFLRLDRPLQAGMVVTIEPGFYQVPALLQNPQTREKYQEQVNWERLTNFSDVRGIRIEDDVLVTETGVEVLTEQLSTTRFLES